MVETPKPFTHTTALRSSRKHGRVFAYAADPAALQRIAQVLDRFSLRSEELADLLDVAPQEFARARVAGSDRVQQRLRQMLDVVERVRPWTSDDREALEWYRREPIPAFGGLTAREMVGRDLPDAVDRYLDGIAVGGFA